MVILKNDFFGPFLSMNLVIMSCYNGKGVERSRISKLSPYKGRVMRPRSVGSEYEEDGAR